MTGTLNNTVPARDIGYRIPQVLRKRITYLNNGVAVTVGVLPAGSVVIGGGVQVVTAFNDSGTDLMNVGTSADADAFATSLDVSSALYKALDELATTDDFSDTAEVTVTATYAGQNSDMTAGVADVIILYVAK